MGKGTIEPVNIFMEEFGDKKAQKKTTPQKAEAVVAEETPSGNIFAETFGVKKKDGSVPSITSSPKSETISASGGAAKLGTSAEKVETQDEEFEEIDIFGTGPLKTQGAVGEALKGVLPSLTPKSPITSIEDFNTKFEEKIGKPEFNLGSDLPQISKAREEKKYLKYSELDESLGKSTQNIFSGEGTMNDFVNVKTNSPKIFEEVKTSLNIPTLKEDIKPGENKEDSYVFDVYNQYKDKVVNDRLEIGRGRRENMADGMESFMRFASSFTGQKYEVPQNLQEAKKIVDDISEKKNALIFAMKNSGGSLNERVAQIENISKEIANGELAMPALTQAISGFVFDEESKKNPNVSTFDVGKRIYELINPQGYALYKDAGGDKIYRAGGGFGQGFSETPKKADAINRQIMELGINAFNTFGNKTAIEVADIDSKSLDWKFTRPIEEETKHMIAARLLASGIKPNKATDEQKDEIAELLPDINRDIWFEKNKPENNVSLPSTGLGYSTKGSYFNTVEDGSKTLLGWMMPGRGRERALDALEQQGTSDIVGENPESKARLSQLREKEKKGTISGEEIKEKESLEQFTDVRTGWQKFKDLSGSGVGQFAGFGTISAFTGGLGNARTVGGALKALVSPMADREGMLIGGYFMSREANARDAAAMFPGEGNGIKRFVAGETFSFIDTYIERLFPEEKFLSGLVKKEVGGLIPKLTAQNIRKELNESLAKKIAKNTFAVIAQQQKTPLQEGLEESIAAKLKDVFHGILDPDREAMTFDDILNIGTQAYLSTQLLGVPKGVMATRNKTVPINAIWDVASDKESAFATKFKILEMQANGDLTPDQANERISLLNTARKEWEESPVLSGNMGNLSLAARQNYLARKMNEDVLQKQVAIEEKKIVPDKNVIADYKKQISESEKARKKIFEGETEVTNRNDERDVPREIKAENDAWKANIQAIGERTDIDDAEKERLKQVEDERHAGEVAQLGKDAELLLKIKAGERVSPDEKKENIQYFIDKVGEAPVAAIERFGEDAVKELLPRVVTEKLAANYYTLAKIDSNSPEALALLDELIKREDAAEMTTEEKKDWNELSMEEKRKLAVENLPEIEDTTEEDEIVKIADDNAKYLLAKLKGEEISRPIVLNPKLPTDKPKVDEAAPEGTEKSGVPVDKSALGSVEGKESKFPKPAKPISEMTADEIVEHANVVRDYMKNQEVEFFGGEGAKKYKAARRLSNEGNQHSEEVKEADRILKEMEDSLTEQQRNEFFGIGEPDTYVYDRQELMQIARTVRMVEEAENINELSRSLKNPLLDFKRNPTDEGNLAVINAAKRKAQELGIDPKELIEKAVKNIVSDLSDPNDAVFLAKSIIERLAKPIEETQSQLPESLLGKEQTQSQKPKVNKSSTINGDKKEGRSQEGGEENISEEGAEEKSGAEKTAATGEGRSGGEGTAGAAASDAGSGTAGTGNDSTGAGTSATQTGEKEKSSQQPDVSKTGGEAGAGQPPLTTSKKSTNAFSDKARQLAEKIRKDGLRAALPDWAKADLPEGTQQSGFGGKFLDEAIAKSIEIVADAVERGIELAEAIREGYDNLKKYYQDNSKSFNENQVKGQFERNMQGLFDASKEPPKPPANENEEGENKGGNFNFFKNRGLPISDEQATYLSKPTIEVSGTEITQPFEYDVQTLDALLDRGKQWMAEAKQQFNSTPIEYAVRLLKDLKAMKGRIAVKAVAMVNLLNSIDLDLRYKELTPGQRDVLKSVRTQLEQEIAKNAREGSLTLNAQRLIHKLYKGEYKLSETMEQLVTEPVQKAADAVTEKLKEESSEISETVREQKRKKKDTGDDTKPPPKPKKAPKEKKTTYFSNALGGMSKENISKLKKQVTDLANKLNCGKKTK